MQANLQEDLLFTEISKATPLFSFLDPISKIIFLMSQEDKFINKLVIAQIYRWSTVETIYRNYKDKYRVYVKVKII